MKFDKWHELKDKTAALSLRERVILMVVGLVLIFFIWAQFYYLGFEKEQKQVSTSIKQLKQQEWAQSEQLADLMAKLAHDPNAELIKEQQRIQGELDALKDQIEIRLSHLIAPEMMADVMRQVLSDYKGLRLVNAKNLPVEPLKISQSTTTENKTDEDNQAVIFSHRFEMTLNGDYFQTLEFLQKLEQMKGFYWTKLSYKVDQYPKAQITIELSTLSLDEDWIGV